MINKSELTAAYTDFVKHYNLRAEVVVVGAGGALVMMGLREETGDIDVTTTVRVFRRFQLMGKPTSTFPATGSRPAVKVVAATDLIDLHTGVEGKAKMCTEGVWHETPEELLAFKSTLNREKDQADIEALRKHLGLPPQGVK